MADIFISYANEDEYRVAPLARALEDYGWSVWWDQSIPPGKTFVQAIKEAIGEAECVVVLWSVRSIESEWVQEEATIGKRCNILVPARIDLVQPPLGFGLIQAADLTYWDNETNHSEFVKFIKAITKIAGPPPKKRETRAAAETTESSLEERSHQKITENDRSEPVEVPHEATTAWKLDQKPSRWKFEQKPTAPETNGINTHIQSKFSYVVKFGAVLGVISLLLVGIWLWVIPQQKDEPPTIVSSFSGAAETTDTIVEELATLYVETVPEDATVTIPDANQIFSQGMEIEPGRYLIRVSLEGYEPEDRWVELAPGDEQRFDVELKEIPPPPAKLYVETIPEGAMIRVLNIKPKFSQGMELEPGRYLVEVTAEEYEPHVKWVVLSPGEEKPFAFKLLKKPPIVAKLYVKTVPENATVTIPEVNQPFLQGMELKPGFYRVKVTAEGYRTKDRWVKLAPREKKTINFVLIKKIPDRLQKTITNSIGMKFVLIPAGSFTMGSPESETGRESDEAQHSVTITCPYYMQSTEVTQGQWEKVMGSKPSYFKNCGNDCPLEQVSWKDAQKFILLLNKKEGVTHYRLPTEAEWEYTCRAGTTTRFSFGGSEKELGEYAWYGGNSNNKTHPVGTRKPNAWGLYGIHGNVYEWVEDWYGNYPAESVVDPKGPPSGKVRVIRGGGWEADAQDCRSAYRTNGVPGYRYGVVGIRLARSVSLAP